MIFCMWWNISGMCAKQQVILDKQALIFSDHGLIIINSSESCEFWRRIKGF